MNTPDPMSRAFLPRLTVEELNGLQDYWRIYELHREEIRLQLLQMAGDHAEFKFIMQNPALQQNAQQQDVTIEIQRRAVFHNEWQPYLDSLRRQGIHYAQAGLSFHAWFEIVSAFRKYMTPHLLDAYQGTPDRLLAAMNGIDTFVEIIMGVIGESYLDTKEQLIHKQEEMIQNASEREREDEMIRSLLESAPDAMIVVNSDGRIILVNSQTEKMFGYQRSEILEQPVEILIPESYHEKHSTHRSLFFDKPQLRPMGVGLKLRGVRRDGSEFPVEISLSPLQTEEGILVTAAIRDITERKRAEEKIRSLNEDLQQRALELESANKELEAFSYSVSHDLRAPLRTIDGFSLAVLEDYGDQLTDEGRDYLMRIRTAAQRMAQLIDDLLNLSRVTRAPLTPEPTSLSMVAQHVIRELQQASPDRIVEFSILPNIVANSDPRLMKVVLENLLGNAWKFTSKQEFAHIEFGASDHTGNGHVFYVRDNGAGFDMAYVNKLFGAFQRLHSSSEFPGIGIGLAIVQRIINRHGGRVWAEGAVDQGATFYFTLSRSEQS